MLSIKIKQKKKLHLTIWTESCLRELFKTIISKLKNKTLSKNIQYKDPVILSISERS